MADPKKTRGYRNKNPGNIDYLPANKWQGQVGIESPPVGGGRARFAVFQSHEFGIRALASLLTTYQDRHGLKTIRGIVNRWAPPSENVTSSYVRFVDDQLPRHTADDVLDLHSFADMRELVTAIIRHELGGMPYDDATIDRGLRLFGLVPPGATAASAATPAPSTDAGILAGVAAAAATAAPAVSSLNGVHWAVGVAIVAGAVALAAIWLLRRQRAA